MQLCFLVEAQRSSLSFVKRQGWEIACGLRLKFGSLASKSCYKERQPSGFKDSNGFPICCIATLLTDTHVTVRPCIRPFADSAIDVIVTLLSDIRGPLYK
jgi:hypothetical protein